MGGAFDFSGSVKWLKNNDEAVGPATIDRVSWETEE
jgi:hypothetical protein